MIELKYKEIKFLSDEQTISISPICSGVHIGSSNWTISVSGEQKYALLNYVSFEGEYRYPKQVDLEAMKDVDVMLLGTTVLNEKGVLHNLNQ